MAATGKTSGCLIEPEQVADIGSSVTGVIESLPVKLGDTVQIGQPLVMLRADVERASAQVAELRSSVDAEARAAQANLLLAKQKIQRTRQLLDQGFVSPQALEQATAEAEVAHQRHKLAQSQQQIYRQEQAVAKAQLGLRTLRSPIQGVVVERFSNLGERVEDRPVVRVASINPLRVSLMIPMAQYGQIGIGDVMTVRPELPGISPLKATVQYVDKVVDAASNTFRVRLTLPNPDHSLPGGLRCKADMLAKAPPAATTPTSAVSRMPTTAGATGRATLDQRPLSLKVSMSLSPLKRHTRLARHQTRQERMAQAKAAGHEQRPWLTASLTLSPRH